MKVIKYLPAGESYVVSSSGRIPAVYAAMDGELVVALFQPSGVRGGYSRSSATLRDGESGRRLFGRSIITLAEFRKWVAEDLVGAFVWLSLRH